MRKDEPVDDRRQQKSEGVTLLENAGEKAARLGRQCFHQERSAEAPLATHADSEKRAQDQEDGEIRRERGQEFDHGIKNDVDHQRNATSESVAQESEEQRTQRPEHQGEHARERDFRDRHPELLRDRRENERQQKEIERVERPAEETGDEGIPLVPSQRLEKPDRFHRANLTFRARNLEAPILPEARCHPERRRARDLNAASPRTLAQRTSAVLALALSSTQSPLLAHHQHRASRHSHMKPDRLLRVATWSRHVALGARSGVNTSTHHDASICSLLRTGTAV